LAHHIHRVHADFFHLDPEVLPFAGKIKTEFFCHDKIFRLLPEYGIHPVQSQGAGQSQRVVTHRIDLAAIQQHGGKHGDTFTAAGKTQTFTGGCLDTNTVLVHPQGSGQGAAHVIHMG